MSRRLELHDVLCNILGSENVYFQPPNNLIMEYPCIRYSQNIPDIKFADDRVYSCKQQYTVIMIDRNPDSIIPGKILQLPFCKPVTSYAKDNLNHYVFNLYF